ncbi:MAG: dihydrolipoyl dehydrogenase [Candidatus Eutrophobiaceae bacterium]
MSNKKTEVVVLGGGPGGYTAAFRAADLGKKVSLVERFPTLGGVCLNVGCIPSKALLHIAKVMAEVEELRTAKVLEGDLQCHAPAARRWVDSIIAKLTGGLKVMAQQRGVEFIQATGTFAAPHELLLSHAKGEKSRIEFEHAIIAAGSRPVKLPHLPEDPRILDSTSALLLNNVPERLLVIGGGIIGLEMATIYARLGSEITMVEMLPELIAGCDRDIVYPLQKRIETQYHAILTETAVTRVEIGAQLHVSFEGKQAPAKGVGVYDAILVATGRIPNGNDLAAEMAGIHVDECGFIPVNLQQRSNVAHIFAVGDIVGQPMLAHKASHQGKVAAEVIAGLNSGFDASAIPSVAYTDPELAWVGMTETRAKAEGIAVEKGIFPWAASGRSLATGRDEGITKLLFDKETRRIIGMAAAGTNAGELIAEGALAIEMGCDAEDIALTIHPHPTLSESIALAAETYAGTITDLYLPRGKSTPLRRNKDILN